MRVFESRDAMRPSSENQLRYAHSLAAWQGLDMEVPCTPVFKKEFVELPHMRPVRSLGGSRNGGYIF